MASATLFFFLLLPSAQTFRTKDDSELTRSAQKIRSDDGSELTETGEVHELDEFLAASDDQANGRCCCDHKFCDWVKPKLNGKCPKGDVGNGEIQLHSVERYPDKKCTLPPQVSPSERASPSEGAVMDKLNSVAASFTPCVTNGSGSGTFAVKKGVLHFFGVKDCNELTAHELLGQQPSLAIWRCLSSSTRR